MSCSDGAVALGIHFANTRAATTWKLCSELVARLDIGFRVGRVHDTNLPRPDPLRMYSWKATEFKGMLFISQHGIWVAALFCPSVCDLLDDTTSA